MANPKDVSKLLNQLHDRKIINLDTSVRSLLEPEGLSHLNPGDTVAAAVVAWDGYGLVIKGHAPDIGQIQDLAASIASKAKTVAPGGGV